MRILVGLLVAGVVEIGVLILVGRVIGVLPTLALLIIGVFLGSWLLRRQGRRTLQEFTDSAFARRPPPQELADGVLAAGGAVLLMVPGFLSDLVGIVCLLPPTRAILRRRLRAAAERRVQGMHERAEGPRQNSGGDYIDGEVVSVTEDSDEERRRLDASARARREQHRD